MTVRAETPGMAGEERFAEGDEVTIISPHVPEHEGETGTIASVQHGAYYALDIGGTIYRWYAESELGGQPGSGAPAPPETPTPDPANPDAPPAARAVARLGGANTAAQLEVAKLAALGRDVMARTGAKSTGAALLKLEAGLVALAEVGPLRAAETKRAAADEDRARRDILAAAVTSGALTRAQAFDVTEANGQEVLAPKVAWRAGSLDDLRAQIGALGASPRTPGPKLEPDLAAISAGGIPPEIASLAAQRGYSPEKTARLAALHKKTHSATRAEEKSQ